MWLIDDDDDDDDDNNNNNNNNKWTLITVPSFIALQTSFLVCILAFLPKFQYKC
jgi:hypothetical protein